MNMVRPSVALRSFVELGHERIRVGNRRDRSPGVFLGAGRAQAREPPEGSGKRCERHLRLRADNSTRTGG